MNDAPVIDDSRPFVPLHLLPPPKPSRWRTLAVRAVKHWTLFRAWTKPERVTSIQFLAAEQKNQHGTVVQPVVIFVAQTSRGMVAKAVLPVPWLRKQHYGLLVALEGAVNRALKDVHAIKDLAKPTIRKPDTAG